MSRTAAFVSARSVRTRSSTLASTVASSPVVGSSSTRSFGSRGERDGDDDALLHAARELVRIALEDPLRIGDLDPAQRRQGALARLLGALPQDRERLDDLRADLGRRVERGARVLVDHRRVVHPELADLLVVHLRDVVAADEDPAAGDDGVARQVAHGGVGRRRLAAARLADQAVRLARAGSRTTRRAGPGGGCRARRRTATGPRPAARPVGGGGRRRRRRRGVSVVIRSAPTGASRR